MTAFFIVSANRQIGLGHWKRCLELAKLFQERSYETTFLTDCERSDLLNDLEVRNIQRFYLDPSNFQPSNFQSLFSSSDILLIDNDDEHLKTSHIQEEFNSFDITFGYFSVDIETYFDCNFIISYNIQSLQLSYKLSDRVKRLTGPEYVIFRDEFYDLKANGQSVIVAMGGSDPYGISVQIIEHLAGYQNYFNKCYFIAGPLAEEPQNLPTEFLSLEIIQLADNVAEIMADSKLAFCGAGNTFNELSLLGIPSWVFASSRREFGAYKAMINNGYAYDLGNFEAGINKKELQNKLLNTLKLPTSDLHNFDSFSQKLDIEGKQKLVENIINA